MKTLIRLLPLAALACWTAAAVLAQQPGPATLEGLVNSREAQEATKAAEAGSTDAAPKRPAGTVSRPKDGVQHPDLDKAWADYDAAVMKAAEGIRAAINKQFDTATAKGDLDAADKWQTALEKFDNAGELPADTETKAAVNAAAADYKKARDELSKAYETVVKSLTMEKKIADAKAVRGEWLAMSVAKKEDAGVPDAKPARRVFLCDLTEIDPVVGWGAFGKDGNLGYNAHGKSQVIVGGKQFLKGLSTHSINGPNSRGKEAGVSYDVPNNATRLVGVAAINDSAADSGRGGSSAPLQFRIVGDGGKVLWQSTKMLQRAGENKPFSVAVSGHNRIRLVVVPVGDCDYGQAVWLDPAFECK